MASPFEQQLQDQHIDHILAEMEKHGVDHQPFSLGTSLAARLDQNSAFYPYVCARFANGSGNLQGAMLQAFYHVEQPLSMAAQELILACANDAANDPANSPANDATLLNQCALTLWQCRQHKAQATAILARLLASPRWFVRGNACHSLAKLRVDDPALLQRLGELLFDVEGNDWSVQSAALHAICEMGPQAKTLVPQLLRLAEAERDVPDYSGWEVTNQLLAEAFGAVGDDSPAVVAALQALVASHGESSARPAVLALGQLGPGAASALETVCEYLTSDAFPADSEETATRLLQAVLSMASDPRPAFKKILPHWQHSPFDDVREVAKQWAWTIS